MDLTAVREEQQFLFKNIKGFTPTTLSTMREHIYIFSCFIVSNVLIHQFLHKSGREYVVLLVLAFAGTEQPD